jgi:trans-L-3-hydroxyproline dehydratase
MVHPEVHVDIVGARSWQPPTSWTEITTIDAHTGGEPLRIITGGYPAPAGESILERRSFARDNLDHLRTALMFEPRGHADMYGCVITPPVTDGAAFGVLFLHNEGYSTMCGHGIIAVTTVAIETGMLEARGPEVPVGIDTPAGLVNASARVKGDRVRSVAFRNVPSFVAALDEQIEVGGVGTVTYDLAFGGAFYAYVDAAELGLRLIPDELRSLIETGMAVKRAIMESRPVVHPFEPDLSFLYGTIFTGPPQGPGAHSRNVCIFAEGEVDRSPTGTGVSGRAAIHLARGEIAGGDTLVIESLIGSRFTVTVLEETVFGPHSAVVPEVEGSAHITGIHRFVIDPDDLLRDGFMLR